MTFMSKFDWLQSQQISQNVWRISSRLINDVYDLILPPRCAGCGVVTQDSNLLCGTCWSDMGWIDRPYCDVSGLPFSYDWGTEMINPDVIANPPFYDKARSVSDFSETARLMVHRLKYHDRIDLAEVMGCWMARAGADCLGEAGSWIVPVPLHRRRLWKRRFNQSALLAQVVARESGLDFQPMLLKRIRSTRQQVGLSEGERRNNVSGAFELDKSLSLDLSDRTVILVDDVWTTGATLEACCRTLRRGGAGKIHILTFARVVDPLKKTI